MTNQWRRAFRACLTAGIMLAGGLALLPAQATTAPRVVLPAAEPVSGLRLVDVKGGAQELSAGPETLDRLLRSADFSAGPTVALDVARKALAQRGGPVQPDLDPTTTLSGESGATGEAAPADGVIVAAHAASWSFPVGDLDGDGGQDLIVRSFVDGGVLTEALSGADAHRLWALPSGAAVDSYIDPGGDVDGDGVDDLAFHSFEGVSGHGAVCSNGGCEWSYRWEFVRKTVVASGATGVSRWTTEEPGWVEFSYGYSQRGNIVRGSSESWRSVRGENLFLGTDLGVPGQTVPGLLTNRIDLDDHHADGEVSTAWVMTLNTGNAELHSVTEAAVIDAVTGATLASQRSEGPHVSVLSWVDQMTGDASPDLLWVANGETPTSHRCRTVDAVITGFERCTDEREDAVPIVRLSVLDGSTLDESWTTDLATPGWVWPGSDLTGDGLADLRLLDYWAEMTQVVSGADGATLWRAPGFALDDMGDLGGGPHPDLVLVRFRGSWDDETRGVSLQRVDGATGVPLMTTDHDLEPGDANMTSLWISRASDAGDSPSGDLVVSLAAASVDWDTAEVRDQISTDIVEDGATGNAIGTRQREVVGGVYPIDDVSGDGLADGISWRYTFEVVEDEWGTYLSIGILDEAVTRLAPVTDHMPLPADRYLIDTIDVDGSGAAELLFDRWAEFPDGGSGTELSVVSAVDGSTRWTWSYSP